LLSKLKYIKSNVKTKQIMDAVKLYRSDIHSQQKIDEIIQAETVLFACGSRLLASVWVRSERARVTGDKNAMPHLAGSCTKMSEAEGIIQGDSVSLLISTQILEEGCGIDLIRFAKKLKPDIKTLLFLEHSSMALFQAAVETNSDGIVLESEMGTGHVIEAISRISRGGFYLEPLIAKALNGSREGPSQKLSSKELEVMQSVVYGLTDKEIGESIFCTSDTVKYHLKNVYNKLGVHNRTRAAICVLLMGLVGPPKPLTPASEKLP